MSEIENPIRDAYDRISAQMADEKKVADAAPEMLEALERAQKDINWMLNSREFLNGHVFDYIDDAIKQARGNK